MSRRQPDAQPTGARLVYRRPTAGPSPDNPRWSSDDADPSDILDDENAARDGGEAAIVIGLSPADIEALRERRESLLRTLVTTESGRELVRRADQQVDQAGRGLAEDIRALARTARGRGGDRSGRRFPAAPWETETVDTSTTLTASRSAAVVLEDLAAVWHDERNHDLQATRSGLYRWAQNAHRWMDHRIRLQSDEHPRTLQQQLLARYWGVLGNLFTFAAASALFWFSAFTLAAALIGARILVTTAVWAMSAYPADDSPDRPVLDADPRICVLGHAGDLLLFTSFAATLIGSGQDRWAYTVILATWGMILATLLRITATSHGATVPRLHLERMVRGGSTLAAVVLASLSPQPTWWTATVAIVTLPSVFAYIEGQEALRAMSFRTRVDPFANRSTVPEMNPARPVAVS